MTEPQTKLERLRELATWRCERRRTLVRDLERARQVLDRLTNSVGLFADSISQVVELELGIGPGDEDQGRRLDEPEYAAALELLGRINIANQVMRGWLANLADQGCSSCDPKLAQRDAEALQRFRLGSDIRQIANGDLVCMRCGRTTSPAPREDDRPPY